MPFPVVAISSPDLRRVPAQSNLGRVLTSPTIHSASLKNVDIRQVLKVAQCNPLMRQSCAIKAVEYEHTAVQICESTFAGNCRGPASPVDGPVIRQCHRTSQTWVAFQIGTTVARTAVTGFTGTCRPTLRCAGHSPNVWPVAAAKRPAGQYRPARPRGPERSARPQTR